MPLADRVPYVSPVNPRKVQLSGEYLRCPSCQCPWAEPIPPRWVLTVHGTMDDAWLTPHLPTCAELRRIRKGGEA